MRATFTFCLLFASGCAGGVQESRPEPILRPRSTTLHVSGSLEPVSSTAGGTRHVVVVEPRPACQTNDPMPTGQVRQPPQPMPIARPLRLAAIPNYCPVAVPPKSASVVAGVPLPQKAAPSPSPSQP
ncbi:MAG: hypothetical protein KY467_16565 [Gemmatimonadetes bacterium]|nr:hypothetical protein [Gemmatimonadota bacterium]